MLGRKARQFQQHPAVCLEDFVPHKNLYRQLEAKLDLSFIHALVAEHYASRGRPSIDPVVFFKLQLIMFFEELRRDAAAHGGGQSEPGTPLVCGL